MTLAPALKLETTYQEGPPISLYFYPLCMDSIPWPYYQCKHIDGSAKIATTTKLKNFLFEDGHFGKGKILGDGKLFQNVNVNVDVQISLSLFYHLIFNKNKLSWSYWRPTDQQQQLAPIYCLKCPSRRTFFKWANHGPFCCSFQQRPLYSRCYKTFLEEI